MRSCLLVALAALAACRTPARQPGLLTSTTPDTALRAPDGTPVPAGALGVSIRRGHAILAATRDSLPAHVGNALRCTSCHLGDGRQRDALPLTGVYARFPQFRSRVAAVQRIEDRVNDCLIRSMHGTPLPFDDPAMRDVVAYLAFISRGVPVGDTSHSVLLAVAHGDTLRGAGLYQQTCARCHGTDGAGSAIYPPLWGPMSFTIGAGMARLRTAATFIRHNMPQDRPGSVSEAAAADIAAWVTSRPRPDLPGKEHDWPRGDAPADTPYPTLAGRHLPATSTHQP